MAGVWLEMMAVAWLGWLDPASRLSPPPPSR